MDRCFDRQLSIIMKSILLMLGLVYQNYNLSLHQHIFQITAKNKNAESGSSNHWDIITL